MRKLGDALDCWKHLDVTLAVHFLSLFIKIIFFPLYQVIYFSQVDFFLIEDVSAERALTTCSNTLVTLEPDHFQKLLCSRAKS